jgi:hypothetical protein
VATGICEATVLAELDQLTATWQHSGCIAADNWLGQSELSAGSGVRDANPILLVDEHNAILHRRQHTITGCREDVEQPVPGDAEQNKPTGQTEQRWSAMDRDCRHIEQLFDRSEKRDYTGNK